MPLIGITTRLSSEPPSCSPRRASVPITRNRWPRIEHGVAERRFVREQHIDNVGADHDDAHPAARLALGEQPAVGERVAVVVEERCGRADAGGRDLVSDDRPADTSRPNSQASPPTWRQLLHWLCSKSTSRSVKSLRLSYFARSLSLNPPVGCFWTWNTPDPSWARSLEIFRRKPSIVAAIATTATTPITMPSSVSAERSLFARERPDRREQRICEAVDHSNLSDSIGSRPAARDAGHVPNARPTIAENTMAPTIAVDDSSAPIGEIRSINAEAITPSAVPIATADHRHERRLDEELHEDRPPPRTQRAPHADLARAFGDRDQHDVHHADAADQQRDQTDRDRDAEQRRRLFVEDLDELGLTVDRERVWRLRAEPARPAKHFDDLLLCLVEMIGSGRGNDRHVALHRRRSRRTRRSG